MAESSWWRSKVEPVSTITLERKGTSGLDIPLQGVGVSSDFQVDPGICLRGEAPRNERRESRCLFP